MVLCLQCHPIRWPLVHGVTLPSSTDNQRVRIQQKERIMNGWMNEWMDDSPLALWLQADTVGPQQAAFLAYIMTSRRVVGGEEQ